MSRMSRLDVGPMMCDSSSASAKGILDVEKGDSSGLALSRLKNVSRLVRKSLGVDLPEWQERSLSIVGSSDNLLLLLARAALADLTEVSGKRHSVSWERHSRHFEPSALSTLHRDLRFRQGRHAG